ncbi:galactosylgalactosylxylosylprotein 3-beta-glucuronosyltransferase S-like [Artemia franciscana]|uniref:galactosylgalactosylxylosylprotein 3-beta-glucuronosyltransferase S-like n=1 Tax=Artemia franciscana TaxID=6661 RepID=UPI0032D9F3C7
MFQAITSDRKNPGCVVKIFLYLCTVGVIITVWMLNKAMKNSQNRENIIGYIESPRKANTIHSKMCLQCPCTCPEVACLTNNENAIPRMISRTAGNPSPTLYVITPTFCRPEQIAELTRLGQTLRQVENLYWIVAEDATVPTPAVKTTVDKMQIPYTILTAPMPEEYASKRGLKPKGVSNRMAAIEWLRSNNITRGVIYFADDDNTYDLELFEEFKVHWHNNILAPMPEEYASEPGFKPKGVSNRMAALEWLRSNNITRGVIYFADDDNTYDLELFEEIRKVKKVGMWPVGLVSHFGLNSPIVKNGKVVGFYVGWIGDRTFPVDMASFGVNLRYLTKFANIQMPFLSGYEETVFLAGLNITNDDIEPLADNCTKILVWHTQAIKSHPAEKIEGRKHYGTNIPFLLDQIQ